MVSEWMTIGGSYGCWRWIEKYLEQKIFINLLVQLSRFLVSFKRLDKIWIVYYPHFLLNQDSIKFMIAEEKLTAREEKRLSKEFSKQNFIILKDRYPEMKHTLMASMVSNKWI